MAVRGKRRSRDAISRPAIPGQPDAYNASDVDRAIEEVATAAIGALDKIEPHIGTGGSAHAVATTDAAGFMPEFDGSSLVYLDGSGAWSTPSGGSGVSDGDKGDIVVAGGGTIWTLDPTALSGRVPTSRTISTTAPLAGGGDLSADRTLSVATFGAGASGVVPASGGGTSNFLRADGTWTPPGGGGGSASSTTVDVDFGATPDTTATATVAAAWVAVGTQIVLRPMGDTADHTAEDAAIEEVNAVAVNLVAGVGFDVIAHSPLGSTGQYRFAAVGV